MGKHLLKLKATNKSKLSDGKTIAGKGRLTEGKIKQLQKYYGLAIRQNTSKNANPTQTEIDVAVYKMKKNIIAILHHCVHLKDPKNNIDTVHMLDHSRIQRLHLSLTPALLHFFYFS